MNSTTKLASAFGVINAYDCALIANGYGGSMTKEAWNPLPSIMGTLRGVGGEAASLVGGGLRAGKGLLAKGGEGLLEGGAALGRGTGKVLRNIGDVGNDLTAGTIRDVPKETLRQLQRRTNALPKMWDNYQAARQGVRDAKGVVGGTRWFSPERANARATLSQARQDRNAALGTVMRSGGKAMSLGAQYGAQRAGGAAMQGVLGMTGISPTVAAYRAARSGLTSKFGRPLLQEAVESGRMVPTRDALRWGSEIESDLLASGKGGGHPSWLPERAGITPKHMLSAQEIEGANRAGVNLTQGTSEGISRNWAREAGGSRPMQFGKGGGGGGGQQTVAQNARGGKRPNFAEQGA